MKSSAELFPANDELHDEQEDAKHHLQQVFRNEVTLDLNRIQNFSCDDERGIAAARSYLDWLENQEQGKIEE